MLNQTGLVINFVGSIFVSVSFGNIKTNARLVDTNNKPVETVGLIHPSLFKWGIVLLAVGFGLMLLNTFL